MSSASTNFAWRDSQGNETLLTAHDRSCVRGVRRLVAYVGAASGLIGFLALYSHHPINWTILFIRALLSVAWWTDWYARAAQLVTTQGIFWILTDPVGLCALLLLILRLYRARNALLMYYVDRAAFKAREWISVYLEANAYTLRAGSADARHVIRHALETTPLPDVETWRFASSSHPVAAANRLAASLLMTQITDAVGARGYEYQAAGRDQALNQAGYRVMYVGNDWKVKVQLDAMNDSDIVKITDTDYFLQKDVILGHGCATLLYTVDPHHAANNVPDGKYYFNANGEYCLHMNGGARYQHKIFAYGASDSVGHHEPGEYTVFAVDRRELPGERQLVALTPIKQWRGVFTAWLASVFTPAPELEYLNPVCSGVLGGTLQGDKLIAFERGDKVALGVAGKSTNATTLKATDYTAARIAMLLSSGTPTITTVSRVIDVPDGQKDVALCQMVLLHQQEKFKMPVVMPTCMITTRHVNQDPGEAKPNAVPIASPTVLGGDNAILCGKLSKEVAFDARYREPDHSKPPGAGWTAEVEQYAQEFTSMLAARVGRITPVDIEDVLAKQSSPAQTRTWLELLNMSPDDHTPSEVFPKNEASALGLERVISPNKSGTRMAGAQVVYALQAALSTHCGSFMPGKTNEQIDDSVARIFRGRQAGETGDVAAMDGSQNESTARAVDMFLRKVLDDTDWVHNYWDLFEVPVLINGVVTYLYRKLASGSPATTFHNTLTIMFALYIAARLEYKPPHVEPEPADLLCAKTHSFRTAVDSSAVSGDDSATTIKAEYLTQAFNMLGLRYTPEMRVPGQTVVFLARTYYPWHGDAYNMCDLLRVLRKLHISGDKSSTALQAFANKVTGLMVTDRHAPVICDLVAAFERITLRSKNGDSNRPEGWRAQNENPSGNPYYRRCDWMDELGVPDGFDRQAFRLHCERARTLNGLTKFPVCLELDLKVKHCAQVVTMENGAEIEMVPATGKKLPPGTRLPKAIAKQIENKCIELRIRDRVKEAHGWAKPIYAATCAAPTQADWAVFIAQGKKTQ